MSELAWKQQSERTIHQKNAAIREQDTEYFDMTPVEWKLCGASLGLGILLLLIFLVLF